MKPRTQTTHEAPELMRELGWKLFEEKRVYGGRQAKPRRRRMQGRPRTTTALVRVAPAA